MRAPLSRGADKEFLSSFPSLRHPLAFPIWHMIPPGYSTRNCRAMHQAYHPSLLYVNLKKYAGFLYQAKSWNRARRVVAKVEWHNGELFPRVGFIVTNLSRPAKRVVRFYNQRGTAEQWIKEGKNAVKWTRLSCHDFVDNQVRLHLFVLAYNLGNFLRQAVLPKAVRHWTLTTLREKLIKIGAKVVRHSRKIVFQMAEVAVPRELFQTILERIGRLRSPAAATG